MGDALATGLNWLTTATPATLLLLVVAFILSGRIVPRSSLQDVRADRDARVAEAIARENVWQEAYRANQQALTEQRELLRDSLEGVHTIVHMLESSREVAAQARRDDKQ